ncbi:MAG: 3-oxoacyl-[acyl-carrier-protein] reductase FabG [Verrucomicrobiae bacterium]|nr:3-oxoacyl-[acyl-carrier-protein] reductase FabG [Verrucomicrobiae bacterium]
MVKKIALVTGASRGIGRACAVALAQNGCHVLINFRSRQTDAATTLALVEQAGGSGELCPFDVTDAAACSAAVSRHPRIDILINNAGIRQDALLVFMKQEQWSEVIATNLSSFYNVTQPVVKQMAMNRWGRVVTIASTAGQTGMPGQVNYAAAKAGLIGASKALAKEVAKRGVTVNVLAPGFIETEMTGAIPREQVLPMIPAGRFGQPDEVAAAAVFLCSESAAYITGAVLNVNGGTYT